MQSYATENRGNKQNSEGEKKVYKRAAFADDYLERKYDPEPQSGAGNRQDQCMGSI